MGKLARINNGNHYRSMSPIVSDFYQIGQIEDRMRAHLRLLLDKTSVSGGETLIGFTVPARVCIIHKAENTIKPQIVHSDGLRLRLIAGYFPDLGTRREKKQSKTWLTPSFGGHPNDSYSVGVFQYTTFSPLVKP